MKYVRHFVLLACESSFSGSSLRTILSGVSRFFLAYIDKVLDVYVSKLHPIHYFRRYLLELFFSFGAYWGERTIVWGTEGQMVPMSPRTRTVLFMNMRDAKPYRFVFSSCTNDNSLEQRTHSPWRLIQFCHWDGAKLIDSIPLNSNEWK